MKINPSQKIIFQSILFYCCLFSVLSFSACDSKNPTQQNHEGLDVQVHEQKAQNPQKQNKNKLEGLLIKKADSFYFVDDFKQAQTLYSMALNNVTDDETKQSITQKLAKTKEKIELTTSNSTTNSTQNTTNSIAGTHKFGVQFIWDNYGTAEIKPTKTENQYTIKGKQSHKNEYTEIDGTLNAEKPNLLVFEGTIKIFTTDCCGKIEKTGKFTFKKHKGRKFWRLQEFNSFCSQYTCAYYLDIFE